MKRSQKRWLAAAGVITAGAVSFKAASHLLTKKLMKVAMDRVEPEERNEGKTRLAGSPELEKIAELAEAAALKLESSGCETVQIIGHDGVQLTGHLRSCGNAKRVIIAMHGWRSTWSQDFGIIADFWHDNQCDVLYVEQRGQGDSGGEYMSFGLLERYDCLTWINWVNERTGGALPVFLAGLSMGAATVLMASELDLPANVCGIAADSAFTTPHAIWKHVSENNLHIPYVLHKAGVDRQCQNRIHMDADAASAPDALKHCKIPVLLIHGTDDHFVPVEMAYENYKACTAPKRLLIVPGADHCLSYVVERETYERTAKEFWAFCEGRMAGK